MKFQKQATLRKNGETRIIVLLRHKPVCKDEVFAKIVCLEPSLVRIGIHEARVRHTSRFETFHQTVKTCALIFAGQYPKANRSRFGSHCGQVAVFSAASVFLSFVIIMHIQRKSFVGHR